MDASVSFSNITAGAQKSTSIAQTTPDGYTFVARVIELNTLDFSYAVTGSDVLYVKNNSSSTGSPTIRVKYIYQLTV